MPINRRLNLRTGTSIWVATTKQSVKPIQCLRSYYDVIIIGAGITGAMAAQAISDLGLSVLVVDRRAPASGSTSASTALIQWEIDEPLSSLVQRLGTTKANRVYSASYSAVRNLRKKIEVQKLACDMIVRDTCFLAGNKMHAVALEREVRLRRKIKLPSKFLARDALKKNLGINREAAIWSSGSLELNPRQLTLSLLQQCQQKGIEIAFPLNVDDIASTPFGCFVSFTNHSPIAAGKVVAATGYEALFDIPKHKYKLISTWALATVKQAEGAIWPSAALIWEASSPYLYFRTAKDRRIIAGGEDEAFLNPKHRDKLISEKTKVVLAKLKKILPNIDAKAEFRWAGTFAASPTGLPCIGPVPDRANVFAILGAGGNGITFSKIAADLAAQWVIGKTGPLQDLFAF
jgi:glycine/D-amino acid oxidase-like deaminating enzyme